MYLYFNEKKNPLQSYIAFITYKISANAPAKLTLSTFISCSYIPLTCNHETGTEPSVRESDSHLTGYF